MKRIAIIPARSGSKGLKNKNIKELNGKPLMAYTILCAIKSGAFDKVFVTTDSEKYAKIAEQYGADASFLRSEKNSSDSAGSWEVVKEVIHKFKERNECYDEIMLLQPTSPLREPQDIINAINLLYEKGGSSVVSLTMCDHSPLWCNVLPEDGNMDNFDRKEYSNLPRQELPSFYRYNGAIYLIKSEELMKENMFKTGCYAYVMPGERSIDIDSELDLLIAETIMKSRG